MLAWVQEAAPSTGRSLKTLRPCVLFCQVRGWLKAFLLNIPRVFSLVNLFSVELGTKSYYVVNRSIRGGFVKGINVFFLLKPIVFLLFMNSFPQPLIHSPLNTCLSLLCSPTREGFSPFPSAAQPSVLLREDAPPYSPLTSPESGSAPVIPCRVCQNAISVEGKIHQHVVKCAICNEATVGCASTQVEFSVIQMALSLKLLFCVCNCCVHGMCVFYSWKDA